MTSKGLMNVSTNRTATQVRYEAAAKALAALGDNLAAHEVLVIQCPRSHHLANVVDTSSGPIMRSHLGPHSHGRRDLPDVAHHAASHGTEQLTLLEPARTDEATVSVWCDCGNRVLVLDEVRAALRGGLHTMHVE